MNDEIKLIVDYDEDTDMYYFVVKEGSETLHFRPGFRTHEDAERIGDEWIREQLGASDARACCPCIQRG